MKIESNYIGDFRKKLKLETCVEKRKMTRNDKIIFVLFQKKKKKHLKNKEE